MTCFFFNFSEFALTPFYVLSKLFPENVLVVFIFQGILECGLTDCHVQYGHFII